MSLYRETCRCSSLLHTCAHAKQFRKWELHHVHIITVHITADHCGRIELVSMTPDKPNSPWPCYPKHLPSFRPPTETNQIIMKSKLLSAQHCGPKTGFISGKGGTDAPNTLYAGSRTLSSFFPFPSDWLCWRSSSLPDLNTMPQQFITCLFFSSSTVWPKTKTADEQVFGVFPHTISGELAWSSWETAVGVFSITLS